MSCMQTGKTTTIMRAAVRDTSVSWHHGGSFKGPLKPIDNIKRYFGIEGLKGVPHYDDRRQFLGQSMLFFPV